MRTSPSLFVNSVMYGIAVFLISITLCCHHPYWLSSSSIFVGQSRGDGVNCSDDHCPKFHCCDRYFSKLKHVIAEASFEWVEKFLQFDGLFALIHMLTKMQSNLKGIAAAVTTVQCADCLKGILNHR